MSTRLALRRMKGSLYFTRASGANVSVPANADFNTAAGTFECWAQIGHLTDGGHYNDLMCLKNGTDTIEFMCHSTATDSGKIGVSAGVGVVAFGYTATPLSWAWGWHHLVLTWGAAGVYIYIDGGNMLTVSAANKSLTWGGNPSLYFGAYSGSSYELLGNMCGIRIYNRAILATEVLQRYQGVVISTGLVSSWNMDDMTGTTVTDTVSGHNGTISSLSNIYWSPSSPTKERVSR